MKYVKLLLVGILFFVNINGFSMENNQQSLPDYQYMVGKWTIVRFDQIVFTNGVVNRNSSPCNWYAGEFIFTSDKTAKLILNNVTYNYTFKLADDYIYFRELSTGKVVDYRFRLSNRNKMIIDHTDGTEDNEKGTSMILQRQ